MGTSTGRDRHAAIIADMDPSLNTAESEHERYQGYPERAEAGDKPVNGAVIRHKNEVKLSPLGLAVVWLIILAVFGPPIAIGLIRFNQWLWSL